MRSDVALKIAMVVLIVSAVFQILHMIGAVKNAAERSGFERGVATCQQD